MDAEAALDEVIALERRHLDPALRASRQELERLLHEHFTEIGASGERWDRSSIIALLASDPGAPVEVSDIGARAVADGVVLVTYVATQAADRDQASFRSSLWVEADGEWRLLFHQGTPVAQSRLSA